MNAESRRSWISLGLVLAGTIVVPLVRLRVINPLIRSPKATRSYIPALESPRERTPFDAQVIRDLSEARNDFYIIGDSMAGTRINPAHLSRLIGGRGVAALLHPGIGSAYWYLAYKNWIVNAGLHPKAVIIFFRDENLTDPLLRVYPGSLDRVARDQEPELNDILAARMNGTYHAVHETAQALYEYDTTRTWLEPRLAEIPVAFSARRSHRKKLLEKINDSVFTLDNLRPMAAADMQAGTASALDFDRLVATSVLPEMVRLSKRSAIRLAFIRVQRRPVANRPPVQSEALQRYVATLRRYLESNGAYFHDDWGDPEQPLNIYEDGDHIAREFQRYYSELFYRKNLDLFR